LDSLYPLMDRWLLSSGVDIWNSIGLRANH